MRLSFNSWLAAAALTTLSAPAFAQLSPGPDPLNTAVTTARTLGGATGTITSTGSITLNDSGVALTINGSSTLVNDGTIRQNGTGRAIDSNTANLNLTIFNNGLISSTSSDAFRVNKDETVSLTNSGTIQVTNGGQAIDWAAISSKTNTLNNTISGSITSVGEDAVRPGKNGTVNNFGTISATPILTTDDDGNPDISGSDGIDIRRLTGITIENSGSIMGRHGIATDNGTTALAITVNNHAGGTISAINGSGLNIDGANTGVIATVVNDFGGTFKGGAVAWAPQGSDGDGIDVDGLLQLTNSGDVLGLGARGDNNAEGIAAGGGSITNNATGRIIGSTLLADAPEGDSSRAGNGILIDNSDGGPAVAVTTITNSGLIQGKSGVGVKIVGTFGDSITNNAGGTIRGSGTTAVIQMGGGADTLINRGAIVSDAVGGSAVDLEDGDDQFTVEGGSASVVGNISGGTGSNTMKITPGAGQNFAYAGSISNFDTVEVATGTVTLSGANAYTGQTLLSGGRLVLNGANRVAAASALVLNGGTLALANVGAESGQTFASLALGDTSTIDLGDTTSLTFGALSTVASGKTLSIVDWDKVLSPNYAIRFVGDLTSSSALASLIAETTIDGLAAYVYFDGLYTNVQAVPVPAAFGLLMSAIGMFGVFRRRRATV